MTGLNLTRAATITEPLNMSRIQANYYLSNKRFNIVPAGRRSGKTAIAKRRLVRKALTWYGMHNARFIAACPVTHQAKKIYWRDLKLLVPKFAVVPNGISEGELTIELKNGAIIQVMGLDVPERVEGPPIAHLLFDEYANMKEEVWTDHARPTLTDTQGTADFIGVPEGRNHYYKMWVSALNDQMGVWGAYTWHTADILPLYLGEELAAEELRQAREDMDILTYRQEYEADFNNFEGRVYYPFNRTTHATERLHYAPNVPLVFSFDFNVSPGVAVICQDQRYKGEDPNVAGTFTAVIGEVWIPRDSNTPAVCRKLIADWGENGKIAKHKGEIFVYGDATGGAKTTQSVAGSDWDLIRDMLRREWGDKVRFRNKRGNPYERVRVNALNTRIENASGVKRLLVDPVKASHVVDDLESVCIKEGTNGEIDKDADDDLTHISDALGYFVEAKHPLKSVNRMESSTIYAA